jgi:hypothetical protein
VTGITYWADGEPDSLWDSSQRAQGLRLQAGLGLFLSPESSYNAAHLKLKPACGLNKTRSDPHRHTHSHSHTESGMAGPAPTCRLAEYANPGAARKTTANLSPKEAKIPRNPKPPLNKPRATPLPIKAGPGSLARPHPRVGGASSDQ